MPNIDVSTIGFTNKTAENFFGLLREAGVRTLLDVRLNNTSQLAGFAKKADLKFFLSELLDASFVELGDLAEPPRIWWRLQLLRKWSHEQVEQIFC